MNRGFAFKIALSLLFILYPLLVYFGLQRFQPTSLALCLVIIAGFRAISIKHKDSFALATALAALTVLIITSLTDGRVGLYLYPLMINSVLLILFVGSLFRPPTIIERIATRQHGELPQSGIIYTRRVTICWCVFFVINGVLSVASLGISEAAWTLYNGLISYVLIALMLAGEYLIRRRIVLNRED